MDIESRDEVWLAVQPVTLSLTRAGPATTASPAEVDPEEKIRPTPAQPAHIEPPPHPIAARPIRRPGATQAQTRTGNPSQICHLCTKSRSASVV
eukprot:3409812-Pyramimonas_sp.AAC.1